jgi:uncharacterized protein
MRIVIAGASGFIGRPLVAALRADGHEVRRLVRHGERAEDGIPWNPATRTLDAATLSGAAAIINLAGENIGAGRWTAVRRERILRSRRDATQTLVRAIGEMKRRPAVLLNASAIGYYGNCGDAVCDETSALGSGFLPAVCEAWETDARAAETLGVRTVLLRFGVILAADGGALGKMLPMFRLGFGGRLGTGRQWMSWIARDDALGAVAHVLTDNRAAGAVNVTAPAPVRNAEFTATLARTLHRPAMIPAPAWALRAAFGAMADEALLGSTRAVPAKLEELGYAFRHPRLDEALRAILV